MDYVQHYREQGYAILPGVFSRDEVAEISAEADRLKAEGMRHHATFRHQNQLYLIDNDPRLGRILRFLQWPAYVSDVVARYRIDRRWVDLLAPLIGKDLKQIINQFIWKTPGSSRTYYAYHQDIRFRRPARLYRDLGTSYIQTAIALDPHRVDNGCLRICAGSHRRGDLRIGVDKSTLQAQCEDDSLRAVGLDPGQVVDVIVDPGDVVMWSPYTVHGSYANGSTTDRRFLLNSYVVAANSERGEWAFRNGEPCPLGEPALIEYADLYTRPEPHYVTGPPQRYSPE